MKGPLKLLIILAILFALNPRPADAALVDKIKAVVNNEVITQSEIDRMLYPIYDRYKDTYEGAVLEKKLTQASKEILDQLVEDRLILSEARKKNITVSEEEIDKKIEDLKANFSSEKEMLESLHQQNLTIKDLRNRLTDQIMINKVIDSEIRYHIQILPQEAESYYRTHIDEYTDPEQAEVSTILIRTNSDRSAEESFTLAADILNRLKEGEDFHALAKNYSEGMNAETGGDMGYVRKGQMVEDIDDAIFELEIGGFTDLVKSPLGYQIFKVYNKKKTRTVSLSEARPFIIDALYRKKAEVKFKKWMEELRENAFISIK